MMLVRNLPWTKFDDYYDPIEIAKQKFKQSLEDIRKNLSKDGTALVFDRGNCDDYALPENKNKNILNTLKEETNMSKEDILNTFEKKAMQDSMFDNFISKVRVPQYRRFYCTTTFAPLPEPYAIDHIVKNGPAMVVFWMDGTKTIVKRKEGEKDDDYLAFCAALAKKIYGNNSRVKRIVDNIHDETKKPVKKSAKKSTKKEK